MYGIIGWTYDAACHCEGHAIKRFGRQPLIEGTATDSEGNAPHPIFQWSESGDGGDYCDECLSDCITQELPTEYANLRA